jgi:hypothetical protein
MGIHILPPYYKLVIPPENAGILNPTIDSELVRSSSYPGVSWEDLHDGVGTASGTSNASVRLGLQSYNVSGKYAQNSRCILFFNVSGIPDGAIITEVELQLYCFRKENTLGTDPEVVVCGVTTSLDNDIVAADYLYTNFGAQYSDSIDWDLISLNAYRSFLFNGTGKAAVPKSGLVKIGVIESRYDYINDKPDWVGGAYHYIYFTLLHGDSSQRPRLVITYQL